VWDYNFSSTAEVVIGLLLAVAVVAIVFA